jgi:arylsulfatase
MMENDWSVGEVLKALKIHGVDNNTLVIFASDNGPWLAYGDHAGSAQPLREGKMTCWEGGLRVPCIMRWPGKIPAGTACNDILVTIDFFPTIARLVGAELPRYPIDGLDIWPLIAGARDAKNPHDAYVYYFERNELQAIVSGDGRWKLQLPHKYITLAGRPPGHGGLSVEVDRLEITKPELYDLVNDISETKDVAAEQPEIVARLLAVAERWRAELGDALTERTGTAVRPAGQLDEPGR